MKETARHRQLLFVPSPTMNHLATRPKGPIDKPEEIGGASLEGIVANHLRAWIDLQQDEYQLSFWRTRTQLEVDFIVYGPNEFCAFEVKNSESISLKDLNGLIAFCEEYPEATPILLYRGTRREYKKGVLILPCEEYLKSIHPEKSLVQDL